ncbi:tRNA (guanosine(46)-N7)-methyltransferase TrmB [bacterium]|nr:tRNA (guanosine(46)-N7)-methyltransferase TrmB [bacterium]
MTFNPRLNPYVSKLEEYRDIIKTLPIDSNTDFYDFIRLPNRLILDLGCGAGNFLRDYASIVKQANFIGFELRYKRLVKGAVKLKKRNLINVKLIQARAEDIDLWFANRKVDEIYINFPDPWPKKRHHKHRLMSAVFLNKVRKILNEENGFLVFKTDHKEYFESVVALLQQQMDDFEIVEMSDDLHKSEFKDKNIFTEFESLFKHKGFPVYYLKTKLQLSND